MTLDIKKPINSKIIDAVIGKGLQAWRGLPLSKLDKTVGLVRIINITEKLNSLHSTSNNDGLAEMENKLEHIILKIYYS